MDTHRHGHTQTWAPTWTQTWAPTWTQTWTQTWAQTWTQTWAPTWAPTKGETSPIFIYEPLSSPRSQNHTPTKAASRPQKNILPKMIFTRGVLHHCFLVAAWRLDFLQILMNVPSTRTIVMPTHSVLTHKVHFNVSVTTAIVEMG